MSKQVCDRKYVMRNVTRQRHPYLGFKAGDHVLVTAGVHEGKIAKVCQIWFGHLSPSWCDYRIAVRFAPRGVLFWLNKEALSLYA